ncbi:MAG: HlyD family efflux transporter periplasmic adaptor subunit [Gemmatimonadota bacterium]
MRRALTPLDHPEDSLEAHLTRHARSGEVIYVAVLTSFLLSISLLPVIRVPVSVQATGVIRPTDEKQQVIIRTSGTVEQLHVETDVWVSKGEELLRMRSEAVSVAKSLLATRISEARAELEDLGRLTGGVPADLASDLAGDLHYQKHKAEYGAYREELEQAHRELAYAEREFARAAELAGRGLLPTAETEQRRLQLERSRADVTRIQLTYGTRWAESALAARQRLEDLLERQGYLQQEATLYTVSAPISGTLEQVAGLSVGSYVRAGDVLAVVSPAAPLMAEIYVPPRDVGLLWSEMSVRLLIDSFNHADWGALDGQVESISSDYLVVGDQPMFRVAVALADTVLELRNGAVGRLRKGMTLRARFDITERSLWQLIRDDINDWLDPARGSG